MFPEHEESVFKDFSHLAKIEARRAPGVTWAAVKSLTYLIFHFLGVSCYARFVVREAVTELRKKPLRVPRVPPRNRAGAIRLRRSVVEMRALATIEAISATLRALAVATWNPRGAASGNGARRQPFLVKLARGARR